METTCDHIPGTPYYIRQFTDRFRYGIDAVLLSWYARAEKKDTVIDLCSGTGIVAIRQHAVYQPKKTYAIEIQEEMAQLCAVSVEENGLAGSVHCMPGDFTHMEECFRAGSIDRIMANPPYLRNGQGNPSPDRNFAMARHEITMNLSDLFSFARRVLRTGGHFYLIHRTGRLGEILEKSHAYHVPVKKILPVASRAGDNPQLVLLTCRKEAKSDLVMHSPLIIYDGRNYTREVQAIYEGDKRCTEN